MNHTTEGIYHHMPPTIEGIMLRTAERLNGCIEWLGSTVPPRGYGQMNVKGKRAYVHRRMWELVNGAIPEGMEILHHCDNPCCVNIKHLFVGTQQDNANDMVKKGRSTLGERHPNVKLTEKQVIDIKNDPRKQVEITKDYGVCFQMISLIKRGKAWKHLNERSPNA
jgi:hypothetical protein